MFEKLGNFTTRHPLVILAIWAIILLLSASIAVNLPGHLLYDISSFTPADSESKLAESQYAAAFPDAARSQLIVLVNSDNETARKTFIEDLNSTVAIDSSITNVTNTTSVYSVQRGLLERLTPELYNTLGEGYDNVSEAYHSLYNATDDVLNASENIYGLRENVTKANSQMYYSYRQAISASQKLFEARDGIASANSGMYQIKAAADVLYGVPASYAHAWDHTNASDSGDARKAAAFNSVAGSVPQGQYHDLAMGYLAALNRSWDPDRAGSSPAAYANSLVKGGLGSSFIDSASVSGEQKQVLTAVLNGLSISAYSDSSDLSDFIVDMAIARAGLSESDRPRMNAIYDLGPNPSDYDLDQLTLRLATAGMNDEKAAQAREIYGLRNNPGRIGNYILENALSGTNNSTAQGIIRDAWGLGESATNEDYDRYVLKYVSKDLNASEKSDLQEVYSWGPNPNSSAVGNFILRKAGDGRNASENQTLAEIYCLGRNATDYALKGYVLDKAAEELGYAGDRSYMYAVLDLAQGMSDEQRRQFAVSWADSHGYDNPGLLPDSATKQIVSGNSTLYLIALSEDGSNASAKQSAIALAEHVDTMQASGKYPGVEAYVTGTPAIFQDAMSATQRDVAEIDKIAIPLILLILGLFFASIVAPFIPMAAIGIAIVTGMGVLVLATGVVGDIFNLAQIFLIVVMLGAGVDYCIFMMFRYREERERGSDIETAVRHSLCQAGKSIACSGVVAFLGFGSLGLIDHGIFMSIGLSAAIGILVAMCAALTLVPAILVLAGDRVFWPVKIGRPGKSRAALGKVLRGIAGFGLKHSRVIVLITLVLLAPALFFASQMTLSCDFIGMMPDSVESKAGFDQIKQSFGSGNVDRTRLVMTMPDSIVENGNYRVTALDQIEEVSRIAAAEPGVDRVYSLTRPYGDLIRYDNLSVYGTIDQKLYESYMDNNLGSDGRTTVVYVAFDGSPYSAGAFQAIDHLRENLSAFQASAGAGSEIRVGGSAAGIQEYIGLCTPKYGIVILLVFLGISLVLLLLLKCIVTPVRLFIAMISVIGMTLGAFTLLFQVIGDQPTYWVLPVSLFCILIGLGGDYVIFMMSRVREEVDNGKSTEDAILDAVEATGPVILLCGVVMATAFASMIASSMIMLKEFGFVLSLGILLDATLMIWLLIPALMMSFKKYTWIYFGHRQKKMGGAIEMVPESLIDPGTVKKG